MTFSDLKSNKTLQSLLLVGVIMLALAAWSVVNATHILGNRSALAQEQVLLSAAQEQEAALEALKQNEKENRELIQEYQELLPQNFDQDALLARMSNAAEEYGVTIVGVTFSETVAEEEVSAVPFQMNISGEYEGVMRFLESVSLDGELVIIHNFTLAAVDAGVEATVDCSSYFSGGTI